MPAVCEPSVGGEPLHDGQLALRQLAAEGVDQRQRELAAHAGRQRDGDVAHRLVAGGRHVGAGLGHLLQDGKPT